MSDKVFIKELAIITTIGVYDWEKGIKQKLLFDIEMIWDNRAAGLSDEVSDCLDYAAVSEQVSDFVSSHRFNLIESVAEQVATLILTQFNCPSVKISVSKPGAILNAKSVGVCIERTTAP